MAVKCQAVRVLFHSHSAIRRLSVDPFAKLWLCFLHLGRRRLRSRHTQTYPTPCLSPSQPSPSPSNSLAPPTRIVIELDSSSTPELDSQLTCPLVLFIHPLRVALAGYPFSD